MKPITVTFFLKSTKEWLLRTEWARTEKAARKTIIGIYGADNVLFPNSVVVPT